MPNQYTNKDKVETTIDDDKQEQTTTVKHELTPAKPKGEVVEFDKPDYPVVVDKPTIAKKEEKKKTTDEEEDDTIIPLSQTREEYAKANIPFPYIQEEDAREVFERQTKGKWTRKVTKIVWLNTLDDQQFIDWSEERLGKSQMGRKIPLTVDHVSRYQIPTPIETVQYDPDNDENKLVTQDRPQEIQIAYSRPFSEKRLKKLIDDALPHRCEFIISQEGARPYSCTKKEFLKYAGDFNTLYTLKSDPTARATEELKK